MDEIVKVLDIFSGYDIFVLGAAMGIVAKAVPIIEERCKYPKIWGLAAPFITSGIGLSILVLMDKHTWAEAALLTFGFGGIGDWLWHRIKGVRKVS